MSRMPKPPALLAVSAFACLHVACSPRGSSKATSAPPHQLSPPGTRDLASAASPPERRRAGVREPSPSSASFLVWGSPPESDGAPPSPSTYWLALEQGRARVVGRAAGVFVSDGREVWRWSTREWHRKTVCNVPTPGTFAEENVFVGAVAQKIGTDTVVEVIAGSNEPLECRNISESQTDLIGSVGPYLFVDSSFFDYGGGAHGAVQRRFLVFDLASRSALADWASEITAPEPEQKAIRESLGERPGSRSADGGKPYVKLAPSLVRPVYGARGVLSLSLCFEVMDTNVQDLWPSMSHGPLRVPDCATARIPARLAPHASVPAVVADLARGRGIVGAGWSSLPLGARMPTAARDLFERVAP